MARLSVNIDHIATLREARGSFYPDPVWAVPLIEMAGADGLTLHLRGDQRHIKERDLRLIKEISSLPLTLEMAANSFMLDIALKYNPVAVTLVPEEEGEKTTQGGFNLKQEATNLAPYITKLREAGLVVCLFVNPDEDSVKIALDLGADYVELNTDSYACAQNYKQEEEELRNIEKIATFAQKKNIGVNAGHALTYNNVVNISTIPAIEELSIGHTIISRAIFVGLEKAVKEMLQLVKGESTIV